MISRAALTRADFSNVTTVGRLAPVTPGDVLREEFMVPLGLTTCGLARDMDVPPESIIGILNGERTVTAETALRLAQHFGTSAELWMNLQTAYDLEDARGG